MAVTHDDVRHIADLARLGVSASRLDDLVNELNGILGHMEILSQLDTSSGSGGNGSEGTAARITPLRSDSSGPIPMHSAIESFAPETRDGFIIVPRLASHASPAAATEGSVADRAASESGDDAEGEDEL